MKTKKAILRTGLVAPLLALAAGYVAFEGAAGATPSPASLLPSWLWTVAWTAPHPPLPQMVNAGGPNMPTPHLVPILYAADPNLAALKDYAQKLGTSAYVTSVAAEYGVTSLAVAPPIVLADPPPSAVADSDAAAWVAGKIGDASLPPNDGNTIYAIIYPPTTAVSFTYWTGELRPVCGSYRPYATAADGSTIPLTMTGFCADRGGLSDVDYATFWTTSAVLGAATSPASQAYNPGWGDTDFAGSGWAAVTGPEIGRMCPPLERTARPADLGYAVPRVYSNAQAAQDHDPCVPAAAHQAYFNAAPVVDGMDTLVKGISVPPGGQAVVPLALFGDHPWLRWELSAHEMPGAEATPSLTFAFDEACGGPGDIRYLTIKRAPSSEPAPQAVGVEIVSTSEGTRHEWLLDVGP
jgi:hypothetical protein